MENGNATATKQDLADVKQELKQDVADVKQDVADVKQEIAMVRSEMHHMYDDVKETMRDGHTALLKAFYSVTESNSKRMAELEGNQGSIRSRMGTIEDRLMEVEKRLNIPPSA